MYDNIIIDSKFFCRTNCIWNYISNYLYTFGIGSGFVSKLSEMCIVQSVTFDVSVTGI